MAATLGMCMFIFVLMVGWRWRTLASLPLDDLPLLAMRRSASSPTSQVATAIGLLERLGGLVHRRTPVLALASERATGVVAASTAVLAVVDLLLAVLVLSTAVGLGWWRTRTAERRRRVAIEADLPSATELLVVALLSGCSTMYAMESVTAVHGGVVAADWRSLLKRVELGSTFDHELRAWGAESGESCERLAEQIIGARESGASVAEGLRRLAGDHRELARRSAEERARRLPVLMLLPLAVCILPAFILVAVVPVTVSGAGSIVFP